MFAMAGLRRRQPGGNQVGVDEMHYARFAGQKFLGERGFTCAVGAGL